MPGAVGYTCHYRIFGLTLYFWRERGKLGRSNYGLTVANTWEKDRDCNMKRAGVRIRETFWMEKGLNPDASEGVGSNWPARTLLVYL